MLLDSMMREIRRDALATHVLLDQHAMDERHRDRSFTYR